MAVRLWLMMMALVAVCILFLWTGQLLLFERNYTRSAIGEMQSRLEPVMEDLKTEDLADNGKLIPYLSKSTNGKLILTDENGKLMAMYTYGHPADLEAAEKESMVWLSIKQSDEYKQLLRGEQYQKTYLDQNRTVAFEIGIPVLYGGERCYVILYHQLDEIRTVLEMNRHQLVILSILLTLTAAVLAALLSRYFTRPIKVIKQTVDRLAAGDLQAAPRLRLHDEIGQLSVSVEQLGQALQRVDVLRKQVIANVSHELRSPLALISGYAEMVRDITWRDDEKRKANLGLIIHEAGRMSEMVSDILDYSQFKAGYIRLNKNWYNLYDIVESETIQCEQSAAAHRIAMRLKGDRNGPPVFVDALKLSQVMRNLLYNAINHTENGQTVTVWVRTEADAWRVSVANPGEEIPEEDRKLIWERYQRSQHQGGRRQGTGLGLSIVSTILDAHGMPYGVDSGAGMNVFWFVCPQTKPPEGGAS